MNDPRSSSGRGGAAKQATATVSDLGTERGERKDLGEVSRGQQDISNIRLHPPVTPPACLLPPRLCASFHVRPLRGLCLPTTCTPRSLGAVRPRCAHPPVPSTTWGYSWCDPSGVGDGSRSSDSPPGSTVHEGVHEGHEGHEGVHEGHERHEEGAGTDPGDHTPDSSGQALTLEGSHHE